MPKFCMKCGRPLSDDLKFCPDCGTAQAVTPSFEQQTVSAPPQQTYPPMQQNNAYPPQQSVGQTQPYTPQPKKSNGKIIALVLGIVIIVVIVLAMVFLFMDFDGNDSDSDDSNINSSSSIVDTWDVIHYYVDTNGEPSDLVGDMINPTMTFNSDGTGTMNFGGTNQNFNYNIVNDKICGMNNNDENDCMDYSLSDNGNVLTLVSSFSSSYDDEYSYNYTYTLVLQRK